MPAPPLTDDLAREAVIMLDRHGTATAAAAALGVPRETFRNRLKRAAERGMMGTKPVLPGFAIKSVASKVDGDWVRQTREAGEVFEAPAGHSVKGVSALVDAEGREVLKWVKTARDVTPVETVTQALRDVFLEYRDRATLTPSPESCNTDIMSVYVVTDLHAGMLAHAPETGADYDTKIASDRLRSCISDLISQAPRSSEALILNLGDYFHANGPDAETPANKHRLDVDSRFYKTVRAGIRVFMDCIDLALQKHDNVRVRCIPGNHDPESSLALTVALSAFYHAEPRVVIEEDPSDFFFLLFGSTLIGACHGHKLPPERMAMTMASLRSEDWGRSKFRWFLSGHMHREKMIEVGSVRCETFQALASRDAYAAGCGFMSGQSMTSVTLHRKRGEIGRHRVNIA